MTRWNCCCAYRVGSKPTLVLYSVGPKFKSWPRRRLYFSSFFDVLPRNVNVAIMPQIDNDFFHPHPSQFVIHSPSCHPTLYNVRSEGGFQRARVTARRQQKNNNDRNISENGINTATEYLARYKPWISDCTGLVYEPQNKATTFLITLYGISGVT